MNNYIKACVQGMWFTYPGINSIKNKWLRWFMKILVLPAIFLRILRLILLRRVEIPGVEMVITTKCTLRCKDCAHLIQHYGKPSHVDAGVLLEDMENLLNAVSVVYVFKLIGGETFLHPKLSVILDRAVNSSKIKFIEVFTNATILPSKELLTSLKHPKVKVQISNYGKYSRYCSELQELLKKENISYNMVESLSWTDTGGPQCRNRNTDELKKLFSACAFNKCNSFLNGEFHICPRSSNGMNLGLVPRMDAEYARIKGAPAKEAGKRIRDLYRLKYISACNYCDGVTPWGKQIPAGIQLKGPEK